VEWISALENIQNGGNMNEQNQPQTVNDDTVVTLEYTLTVEGEVIDTSKGSDPIQFIQGQQQIIPGLERQLYGMSVGETKEVIVQASEAYGEVDPENYAMIPRDQFPPEIPVQPGIQLELTDEKGERVGARIAEIEGDNVRLDFNHPLAGKDLHFDVEVIDLRQATDEEIEHGHVHDEDGEHDYEDEE
jgi:FKBP-type peptidyl-prolyl cis-trans isomerase SlyD